LNKAKKDWRAATRPNVLFLSQAAYMNSSQLLPIHEAISNFVVFPGSGTPTFNFTVDFMKRESAADSVLALMKSADTGIGGISFKKEKGEQFEFKINPDGAKLETQVREFEHELPIFSHSNSNGQADIGFHDESEGTQKFFGLAGFFLDILEKGNLVAIDELDRSLHPLLVRKIVEMFNDPESNPKGAQLLFTTHDTTLLDPELLRRDQIWFVEKNQDQSSNLFSLSDISVRKGEAFAKGYLSGRYGALPVLEKFHPLEQK
jgi:AAA15 family ATPase/GTPase